MIQILVISNDLGMRRCFFSRLLKFKMAAMDQPNFFCGRKKVSLNFKMAALDKIHNFLWAPKLKN